MIANTYRISFDLDGGELGEGQTNPTSYDVESEQFSPNAPTREGYDFEGWLLSGDVGGTASRDLTLPTGTTGDREYIAQWTLHLYTLSYALNGGTVSPDNPTSYSVESTDIKPTNPTRTGYTFAGWTGTGLTGAMKAVTIAGHFTENKSYTANWTENASPESPDALRSIIVEISGDETLTTNGETSASMTFAANVKWTYLQVQTRALGQGSYVLTWVMSDVKCLSFSDGILTVRIINGRNV